MQEITPDIKEAAKYFARIIQLEFGIEIEKIAQPHAEAPNFTAAVAAERQIQVTSSQSAAPTNSQVTATEGPIQLGSYQEAINQLNNVIQEIKSFVMMKIEALEKRIYAIERILQEKLARSHIVETRAHIDNVSIPSIMSLSVDNVDLLIHEATRELSKKETSIEHLVKLEAIEWQLLKALENNEQSQRKIPKELLSNLRLEIAQLRKSLLE